MEPPGGGLAAAPAAGASSRGRFAARMGVAAGDGAGVALGVARGVAPREPAGVPRTGVA